MNDQIAIPASIVLAGAIIAAAIFFSNTQQVPVNNPEPYPSVGQAEPQPSAPNIDAEFVNVTGDDHRKGSEDAPITIVEYSDLDCPFCTRFHATMEEVLDNYEGKVSWVYRHFPLSSIHPNAETKALATECVATQLGNDAFWKYTDTLFEQKTPVDQLQSLAVSHGADESLFATCMEGNNAELERVRSQSANAQQTGGQGTPWSLLINADGEVTPINGAQPYAAVSAIIEANL